MTKRAIAVQRNIPAPASDVWAVMADFPNISSWNSGVKTSHAVGEATGGVGARRHCDLAPAGSVDERIIGWEEERQMVVAVDKATVAPIRSAEVTFTLTPGDDHATHIEVEYRYQPKALGRVIGRFLNRQLSSGFTRWLEDLEKAALNGTG